MLQATALAFGSYHASGLLVEVDKDGYRDHPHTLYTWGRGEALPAINIVLPCWLACASCLLLTAMVLPAGFYGQLGHGTHGNVDMPQPLCLGYAACTVRWVFQGMCLATLGSGFWVLVWVGRPRWPGWPLPGIGSCQCSCAPPPVFLRTCRT